MAIEATGFRAADDHECWAATGDSAAEQCFVALGMDQSQTLTVFNDDYPVAMFGVVPFVGIGIEPGWGVAWLLASEGLGEIKRDFLYQAREWLDFLQMNYPFVLNYVHAENTTAIAWCRWMGFVLDGPAPYGVHSEMFHRATRRI